MDFRLILKRRLALSLIAFGAGSLFFGAGNLIRWSWDSIRPQAINLQPIANERAGTGRLSGEAVVPAVETVNDQAISLAQDLGSSDPDIRQDAIFKLRALAATNQKSLAIGLPLWVTPLLNVKAYNDLDQFALSSILERPFDPVVIEAAQRAHVLVLISQGNFSQALLQAKSYYNVASLAKTGEAVDLLSQVLLKTDGNSTAKQFDSEQHRSDHSIVLSTIRINPLIYHDAIEALMNRRNGHGEYSHSSLMAQGNLLLLSGRLNEARECFEAACRTETTANKNLRQSLEGLAKVIRAQNGNAIGADAFIMLLRKSPELAGQFLADSGTPWEELRIAAQQITLSEVASPVLPALEQQRARQEELQDSSYSLPQVESGFEASTPVYVAALSASHLVVEITTPGFRDWFMFQLHGVAGKTVRIDITGAYKTVQDWHQKNWSLNPMYTDANGIDEPTKASAAMNLMQTVAPNGPVLPDTKSQSWHYISDVWSDDYTLSFVQRFETDSVYVAMRVPRTPTYNEHFLHQLASNPLAKVMEIGKSKNGRPLKIAQIGTPNRDRPCILLYAQEHSDEQDAGWVAQGALEYLTGDSPDAVQMRENFTFLVIPTLDPDASAAGVHQAIISSFLEGHTTPESVSYANWFQDWVNQGNRLDLVIDLHNIQSGEGPHLFCPLMEATGVRGTLSFALHRMLLENMQEAGYGVQANPLMRGWMPDRLGGWLSHYFGPISIAYEVNSQAPERHLTLSELKTMGAVFVQTTTQFLATLNGRALLTEVDSRREQRSERWSAYGKPNTPNNAITSEAIVSKSYNAKGTVDLAEQSIQ